MSVFIVEEYLIKPDEQGEYKALMQRLLAYRKENPKLFKEVKSFRPFHQIFCGLAGAYVEMWEFDSMADLEKREMKESENEESMKIHKEFVLLVESATFSIRMCSAVE